MKKLKILIVLLFFIKGAEAQKLKFQGYSGSMFVHSGYIESKPFQVTNSRNETQTYSIGNPAFGIGGKLALQFGKGLRFGLEGYNTKTTYSPNKSTFEVGWGGVLVDYLFVDRVLSYFGGVTLGAGRVVNTLVIEEPANSSYRTGEIMRRGYSVGIANPFVGFEIRLNPKLLITVKGDYMFNFTNTDPDWGRGFRVYLGVTFRPEK